jgi:hypothetical protein
VGRNVGLGLQKYEQSVSELIKNGLRILIRLRLVISLNFLEKQCADEVEFIEFEKFLNVDAQLNYPIRLLSF